MGGQCATKNGPYRRRISYRSRVIRLRCSVAKWGGAIRAPHSAQQGEVNPRVFRDRLIARRVILTCPHHMP